MSSKTRNPAYHHQDSERQRSSVKSSNNPANQSTSNSQKAGKSRSSPGISTHEDPARLASRLDYRFKQPDLLIEALSHRSTGSTNNERLEFLGDGALNFIIATELYHRHSALDEGALSRLRATLVKGVTLADIARQFDIGNYLRLGSGELASGGFNRDSILEDAVEAIIGAVYLDGGFDACRNVVLRLFSDRIDNLPPAGDLKDAKTRLQELLQGQGYSLPVYELTGTQGKAHARIFTVQCAVSDFDQIESATGSSRRKAEQNAAQYMLDALQVKLST